MFWKEVPINLEELIISEEAEINIFAFVHFVLTVSTRQMEEVTNVKREQARIILK